MGKILVVVESPNKILKISSFLGSNYKVEASYGIFRDLDKKKMSIDFENNFEPQYVVTKPDVVKKLKQSMQGVDMLYIASDLDYEGENIAQSIYDILKPKQYKRLIFNAITKDAILNAINTAGKINNKKVDAQKTRRVLDRLYGYLISPILQQKLGKGLSAGRVQSVASRIVIDKENEIKNFIEKNNNSSSYKTTGVFSAFKASLFKLSDKATIKKHQKLIGKLSHIELNPKSTTIDINVKQFLDKCSTSEFIVHFLDKRDSSRSPSPPFTTSTLQQEANRKFGMSLETTMSVAQKLYEAGYITYMRTDSVEISVDGHIDIKKIIIEKYGKECYNKNVYKNKSESSQEAHEAIRPVHPELITIKKQVDDDFQIRLYNLIWQRTIASQMANAIVQVDSVQISISDYISKSYVAANLPIYFFQATNEIVVFKGFMQVYVESTDEDTDSLLATNETTKSLKLDQKLIMTSINCKQEYMRPPTRYTPASLVKKLEHLGIGRPSTYVNTLKVIMERDYVMVGDITGTKKKSIEYSITNKSSKIMSTSNDVLIGADTKKLIPTNVGINVNTFLLAYFSEIMSYDFTASVERDMDEVANGNRIWHKVIQEFYNKLIPMIEKAKTTSTSKVLGHDKDNNEISVTIAKYGPVVKKKLTNKQSNSTDKTVKIKYVYAKIKEPYTIDTITLKQAIQLLEYPKIVGVYNNLDILLQKGDNNYYIIYDHVNYAIESSTITVDDAIEIIKQREKKSLGKFDLIDGKILLHAVILEGQYGKYIQVTKNNKKENFPIPKNIDITDLTSDKVLEIIKTKKKKFVKKNFSKKSTNALKKTTVKTLIKK